MNDCLSTAAKVQKELLDYVETFRKETELLDALKCRLLQYRELESFEWNGRMIQIKKTYSGYSAEYDGIAVDVETDGGLICGMSFIGV